MQNNGDPANAKLKDVLLRWAVTIVKARRKWQEAVTAEDIVTPFVEGLDQRLEADKLAQILRDNAGSFDGPDSADAILETCPTCQIALSQPSTINSNVTSTKKLVEETGTDLVQAMALALTMYNCKIIDELAEHDGFMAYADKTDPTAARLIREHVVFQCASPQPFSLLPEQEVSLLERHVTLYLGYNQEMGEKARDRFEQLRNNDTALRIGLTLASECRFVRPAQASEPAARQPGSAKPAYRTSRYSPGNGNS